MEFKWRGEEFKKSLHQKKVERLERAAITLQVAVKEAISEPSNKGASPSDPGQPPHKDTGRLRGSISHEVDGEILVARIGTNVVYGKFLELGTRKMAARSFLQATLNRIRSQIGRILKGG